MQAIQPKFAASRPEAQTIILNWVQATEDFHRYYCQVNEAINSLHPGKYQHLVSTTSMTSSRAKLQALTKLRQYMSDVLATLLADMSKPEISHHHGSKPSGPSKPGQLTSHTRLLQEINRKVYNEVKLLTVAQA